MKKFVAFVMILSLGLFCAAGCNKQKPPVKPTKPPVVQPDKKANAPDNKATPDKSVAKPDAKPGDKK